MKLRATIIFVVAFVIIFATLNFSSIINEFNFATRDVLNAQSINAFYLPLSADKKQQDLTEEATLVIEKLNISAPIIFSKAQTTDAIYTDLKKGVVVYPGSVKPGEQGSSLILGHSSSYLWDKNKYGNIFALINKLQIGDTFSIRYADGQTFRFQVDESLIFNPFDSDSLAKLSATETSNVILMSCWPTGTSLKRIGIKGVRI